MVNVSGLREFVLDGLENRKISFNTYGSKVDLKVKFTHCGQILIGEKG
jgi:hypothetical protein